MRSVSRACGGTSGADQGSRGRRRRLPPLFFGSLRLCGGCSAGRVGRTALAAPERGPPPPSRLGVNGLPLAATGPLPGPVPWPGPRVRSETGKRERADRDGAGTALSSAAPRSTATTGAAASRTAGDGSSAAGPFRRGWGGARARGPLPVTVPPLARAKPPVTRKGVCTIGAAAPSVMGSAVRTGRGSGRRHRSGPVPYTRAPRRGASRGDGRRRPPWCFAAPGPLRPRPGRLGPSPHAAFRLSRAGARRVAAAAFPAQPGTTTSRICGWFPRAGGVSSAVYPRPVRASASSWGVRGDSPAASRACAIAPRVALAR